MDSSLFGSEISGKFERKLTGSGAGATVRSSWKRNRNSQIFKRSSWFSNCGPAAGQSIVGVALQPARLPAEPLKAGDRIRIVDTPASQGEPPASSPQTIPAVVVSTAALGDNGQSIVNVTVPSGLAADLAARVATGRIALILDSRER